MALVYESHYLFGKNIKSLNQNGKNCWRYIEFKVKQKNFLNITQTGIGITKDYVSAIYVPTNPDAKDSYTDVEVLKVLDHIENGNYETRPLADYAAGIKGTRRTFFPAESAIINLLSQVANDYDIHVDSYYSTIYQKNYNGVGGVQFILRIFFKDVTFTKSKLCTFFDSLLIKYGFTKDYDKFGIIDHSHTAKEYRRAKAIIKGKERYEQDILLDKNGIVIQAGDIIVYPRWGTVHLGKVKRNTKVSVYVENATYYIRANTCMVIKSANLKKMKDAPWENVHCEIVNAYKDYF